MRAITRGADPNALRSLLGFLVLMSGVSIATDQAWEAPEGRFGFRLPVLGVLVLILAACVGPKGLGETPLAAARVLAEDVEQWLAAP